MPVVHVSQYDADSRAINFTLYNGTELYEIPDSGITISARGTKMSGNGFVYQCTYSNNIVEMEVKDQMTLYAGDVPMELRIVNTDGDILGTANFILRVEQAALDSDTPVSDEDLSVIEQFIDEMTDLYNEGNTAILSMQAELENFIASDYAQTVSLETTVLDTDTEANGGSTITLSEGVNDYDFLDIYVTYRGMASVERFAIDDLGTEHAIRIADFSNTASSATAYGGECNFILSSASVITINTMVQWYWGGSTSAGASASSYTSGSPMTINKIVAIKKSNLNELLDIRVGYDGTIYSTAGDAVRSQIESLIGGGGQVVVDAALSSSSVNPVQNKVIYTALQGKADAEDAGVSSVNGQTGAVTISNATTSAAGLMSATDKANLDAVYADYSSAITALGA